MSEKTSRNWFAGKGFPQVISWLLYAISFFWGLVILLCYISQNAQKGVTAVPMLCVCGVLYLVSPFLMALCTRRYQTVSLNRILFIAAIVLAVANLAVGILMIVTGVTPASAGIISGIVGIVTMPGALALHILFLDLIKHLK